MLLQYIALAIFDEARGSTLHSVDAGLDFGGLSGARASGWLSGEGEGLVGKAIRQLGCL